MDVRAHLRYLRLAPRKVRLVINLIRGLSVDQATDQLSVLPKGAARPIQKLLNSAIANAEHNFHLARKDLRIKSVVANEGPRLKRYQPRAFGRAAEILKRTTHITIILEDKQHSPAPKKAQTSAAGTTEMVPAKAVKQEPLIAQPVKAQPATRKVGRSSSSQAKARSAVDKEIRRQGTS